jgi:hypothetical protein
MKEELFPEMNRTGRQAAFAFLRRSVSGKARLRASWDVLGESIAHPFMKKPTRRNRARETNRPGRRGCLEKESGKGSWAFNLASDCLFALGSTERVRRVAYRGPDGQLRFLPL